jgi:carbamate kinase
VLLILTDVPKVQTGYGSLYPEDLDRLTVGEAKALMATGEFGAGSMGPKVQAALNFVAAGGRRAVIGELDTAPAALRGEAGTEIVPDPAG